MVESNQTNIFSRIFVILKFKKRLNHQEDYINPFKTYKYSDYSQNLKQQWHEQTKKKSNDFKQAVFKVFGLQFMLIVLTHLCVFAAKIGAVIVITYIIDYVYYSDSDISYGILLGFLIVILNIVGGFFEIHYYINFAFVAESIRCSVQELLMEKLMVININELNQKQNQGTMLSLFSKDFEYLADSEAIVNLASYPILFLVLSVIIQSKIGIYSIVIIISILLYATFIALSSKFSERMYEKIAQLSDQRNKYLVNVLEGIHMIKLYDWVDCAVQKLRQIKTQESQYFSLYYFPKLTTLSLTYSIPALILMLTYNWMLDDGDSILETDTALMFILLFIVFYQTAQLKIGIDFYVEFQTNILRVQNMLLLQDCSKQWTVRGTKGISITNASFSYKDAIEKNKDTEAQEFLSKQYALQNISLEANEQEFIVVLGQLASGKTSFLKAILGELYLLKGSISVSGTIAYVGAEPIIFNDTIRNNILLGKEFDQELYNKVIFASCLDQDISRFSDQDQTIVDERGTSLSGGQQKRLSLARALYANRDIYLLDDPLSAVDQQVRDDIFERSFLGMLKSKIRILCTYQQQAVQHATQCIVLERGEITFSGQPSELELSISRDPKQDTSYITIDQDSSESPEFTIDHDDIQQTIEDQYVTIPAKEYYKYLLEFFQWKILLALGIFYLLIDNAALISTQYWLSYWSNLDFEEQKDSYYIQVMLVLSLAAIVLDIIANNLYGLCLTIANKTLFVDAVKGVLNTKWNYFLNRPIGGIISCLSRDVVLMDNVLVLFMQRSIIELGMIICGYLYIMWMLPYNIIPVVIILVIYWYAWYIIIPITNHLRAEDLATKGPVYSAFTSTLHGLVDIRCYNAENLVKTKLSQYIESNYRVLFNFFGVLNYFTFSANLCARIIFSANIILIIIIKDAIPMEVAVTTILLAFTRIYDIYDLSFYFTMTESLMVSQQRVKKLSQLKPEKSSQVEIQHEFQGQITYEDVYLSYNSYSPFALQGLSFHIPAKTKVGIIGRTGSGKSSIINVLFNLVKYQRGRVLIDDIEIQNIPISQLRGMISIIPQHPFLFHDTFRNNIDPKGQYTNVEIMSALARAQILHLISENGQTLDTMVNIKHLSNGEKQLISLARAILKRSNILVLDEATSNISPETDQIIQMEIRQVFQHSTILAIAHRLDTIKDYDKLMVLSDGKVLEYADIEELKADPSSYYYNLLQSNSENAIDTLDDSGQCFD